MARVKAALYLVLLVAIVIKVLWWVLEPAVPIIAITFALIVVYSYIFRRRW
jgi:membrane protein YdbS with pleckstrin-like domain